MVSCVENQFTLDFHENITDYNTQMKNKICGVDDDADDDVKISFSLVAIVRL